MEPVFFVNGEFYSASKATLKINDLALLRGYGIFDFFRTSGGRPFLMEHYLGRFLRSAEKMDLNLPLKPEEIVQAVYTLVEKNKFPETGIRMILTGGYTDDGYTQGIPNFFILAEKINFPDEICYREGVKLVLWPHLREWSDIKTINYLTPIRIRKETTKRGGYDVLYHYQDQILEVSRSNFFIVREEVLITPTKNVLHGVTRKTILELAEQEMKIEMRVIQKDELALADEAFLTGTTKRIMPVTKVDDLIIGKGSPGKWTKVLMNVFAEYEKKVSAEKV